jgi:hypothetical protein
MREIYKKEIEIGTAGADPGFFKGGGIEEHGALCLQTFRREVFLLGGAVPTKV